MTYIVGGASTQSRQPSKRPTPEGETLYTVAASGCTEYLSNGQRVVSYPMSQYGPLFGFAPAYLDEMNVNPYRMALGSYPPPVEKYVAELLGKIRPDVEAVRFAKNGSDVCAAAVRLARAVTGRDRIAAYGYHGFASEFAHSPANRGVPQCVQDLVDWFEWESGPHSRDIACVIVEVPPAEYRNATANYLEWLSDYAHSNGALFILDEIVTGFRFALGGAAEYYGVQPDLYLYGKAMSNGYAVSCLGGRAALMEEFNKGVFLSGTFFDSPLELTAAQLTLEKLIAEKDSVYPHLWKVGGEFKAGFNQLAATHNVKVRCVGQEPRTVLAWEDEAERKRFNLACLARGVLFDRPQFISTAHTSAIVSQSLDVVEAVFKEMSNA